MKLYCDGYSDSSYTSPIHHPRIRIGASDATLVVKLIKLFASILNSDHDIWVFGVTIDGIIDSNTY